jgi:hypothetical protein
MPQIDLSILNQRQTPAFYADVLANRPAAGFIGRIFVSTNTFEFYRDNGTGWDLIGGPGAGTITGSGAAGQVTYWNGASTVTGDNGLFYDSVNDRLGIATTTPGAAIDAHSTQNVILQLNQTTATNNTKIAFQNSGTALWRIGNNYGGGTNSFVVTDAALNINRFSVLPSSGQTFVGDVVTSSGLFVVNNSSSDAHIVALGATAPSIRVRNAGTGASLQIGLGLATTTNNFIQGSTGGEFCIFNDSLTAQPILFGIKDAGSGNTLEAARISAARNFIINSSTDAGFRFDVNGTSRVQGATTISGSVSTTATNQYFNTWRGTQNVSGLSAFNTSVHTYINPTISSAVTNLRPVAVAVVPTFSGTIDTKVAVFASTSGIAPSTAGSNSAFFANSNETNAIGFGASIAGTNSIGFCVFDKPSIGLDIIQNPTNGIRINRNSSTAGAYTPINIFQQVNGTPLASIMEYRNTATGNSSVLNALELRNSSTGLAGTLGNGAGIQLQFSITNPSAATRTATIAAIAPSQSTLPDLVNLRFQVTNTSGTTIDLLTLSSQGSILDSAINIGSTSPNASAQLQVDSTTRGFLLPRMTTAQKNAIGTPATGLVIYDTTLNKLAVFTGVNWETVTSL